MFRLNSLSKNIVTRFTKTINLQRFNRKEYNHLEELKTPEEININLLNFNLNIINLIVNQEYEILQLQNYKEVENKPNLYEILYLGLQEKFLSYSDMKPLIEAFYQTGRLNEKQYLTLTKHYYLDDKEYE